MTDKFELMMNHEEHFHIEILLGVKQGCAVNCTIVSLAILSDL